MAKGEAMKTCSTCNSARCGNHAACARREEACPWKWWAAVAYVESGVQLYLRKLPRFDAMIVMSIGMDELRWKVASEIEAHLSRSARW